MEKYPTTNQTLRNLAATAIYTILLLALITAAARQNNSLTRQRLTGKAGIAPQVTDPPAALSFIVVGLGAFRGLAAEALWFRADQLQLEGRYFELVQLASWITALDPYAADAWAYNAWNLSYNISALMLRDEDRARWVFHGISLLRDEALKWNPASAQLCRELAWLYLHKVGDNLDRAAPLYRKQLSTQISPLLGDSGLYPNTSVGQQLLCENWRLNKESVSQLTRQVGLLDWRQAESHALYWGLEGVARTQNSAEVFKCRRIACHAMMALIERHQCSDLLPALLNQLAQLYKETPSPAVRRLYSLYIIKAIQQASATGNHNESERLYTILLKVAAKDYMIPLLKDLLEDKTTGNDLLKPLQQGVLHGEK